MLDIQDIKSGYGKITILRNLRASIGNESVGLFGPNGAGKTTMINTIMGLVKAFSGSITFEGEDITGIETHEIVKKGIAVVPQERELFPLMSVYGNLELGAAYIPHAREMIDESFERVFEIFPILKERRKQLAGTLSGGQQRMLAIGRALMAKPKLLILDEPSLGLQPSIVTELFSILQEMKKDISIFVTEQNVRESLKAVDRGYVLENGRIVISETAAELAENPHVVKSYLGL